MLTPTEARRFYDGWGARQDSQGWYEDEPCRTLIAAARFSEAESVLELGCGTGRFARTLLEEHLPPHARYQGQDISATMIRLSRDRLRGFSDRVELRQTGGSVQLEAADRSLDRVVATYVLDLLDEAAIRLFLAEARRVLRPHGRLCLVNLTHGPGWATGLVSRLWRWFHRVAPRRVGGCRPLDMRPFLAADSWRIEFESVVVAWGLSSQVLVATLADQISDNAGDGTQTDSSSSVPVPGSGGG